MKKKDFSLTDITGDSRLLNLLLKKSGDIYSLSNFYSEFTNFNVEKEDSFRFHGFKDEFKLMSMTLSTSIVKYGQRYTGNVCKFKQM